MQLLGRCEFFSIHEVPDLWTLEQLQTWLRTIILGSGECAAPTDSGTTNAVPGSNAVGTPPYLNFSDQILDKADRLGDEGQCKHLFLCKSACFGCPILNIWEKRVRIIITAKLGLCLFYGFGLEIEAAHVDVEGGALTGNGGDGHDREFCRFGLYRDLIAGFSVDASYCMNTEEDYFKEYCGGKSTADPRLGLTLSRTF